MRWPVNFIVGFVCAVFGMAILRLIYLIVSAWDLPVVAGCCIFMGVLFAIAEEE